MTPSVASMIWSMLLMPSWFSIFLKSSSSKTFRGEQLAHLVPCTGYSMLRAPLINLHLWKTQLTWKILQVHASTLVSIFWAQLHAVSPPLPPTSGCRDNLDATPAHAQSLADQLDVLSILGEFWGHSKTSSTMQRLAWKAFEHVKMEDT